jgi:hypothetical protein
MGSSSSSSVKASATQDLLLKYAPPRSIVDNNNWRSLSAAQRVVWSQVFAMWKLMVGEPTALAFSYCIAAYYGCGQVISTDFQRLDAKPEKNSPFYKQQRALVETQTNLASQTFLKTKQWMPLGDTHKPLSCGSNAYSIAKGDNSGWLLARFASNNVMEMLNIVNPDMGGGCQMLAGQRLPVWRSKYVLAFSNLNTNLMIATLPTLPPQMAQMNNKEIQLIWHDLDLPSPPDSQCYYYNYLVHQDHLYCIVALDREDGGNWPILIKCWSLYENLNPGFFTNPFGGRLEWSVELANARTIFGQTSFICDDQLCICTKFGNLTNQNERWLVLDLSN